MSNAIGLMLCLFFFVTSIANAQQSNCNLPNKASKSGETLTYKIYYSLSGVKAATGEVIFTNQLKTYNNLPVYHFKGVGKTYKAFDWFFKVRDTYETYVDTSSMLPLKFVRKIEEGSDRKFEQYLFNHKTKKVVVNSKQYPIEACTHDVLSIIYNTRNINFSKYKIGDKIPISIFLENQTYDLYIRYLGKENIKTKYGEYQTIKFKPLLIEGTIFKGGEGMTVWVTDDKHKIPVYIETPILVGNVQVYLSDKAGL